MGEYTHVAEGLIQFLEVVITVRGKGKAVVVDIALATIVFDVSGVVEMRFAVEVNVMLAVVVSSGKEDVTVADGEFKEVRAVLDCGIECV